MNNLTNTSLQSIIEHNWDQICGSWDRCNAKSIESFLSICLEQSLDPQFCMSWVEQHKEKIKDWNEVSRSSQDWINAHTSSGSPVTINMKK